MPLGILLLSSSVLITTFPSLANEYHLLTRRHCGTTRLFLIPLYRKVDFKYFSTIATLALYEQAVRNCIRCSQYWHSVAAIRAYNSFLFHISLQAVFSTALVPQAPQRNTFVSDLPAPYSCDSNPSPTSPEASPCGACHGWTQPWRVALHRSR